MRAGPCGSVLTLYGRIIVACLRSSRMRASWLAVHLRMDTSFPTKDLLLLRLLADVLVLHARYAEDKRTTGKGGIRMKGSSRRVSRAHTIVCPACEMGELHCYGPDFARCDSCGRVLNNELVVSLRQIAFLPDAVGAHACECGHPEMRLLPDGVFWCPSCGSEVLPIADAPSNSEERSPAYRIGWLDGRFKNIQNMAHNRRLAKLEDALDRLDYYRGHRAGRKACLQERPITSERAVHNR